SLPQYGPDSLQVEVRMFVSINGRKPTLVFDPNVNLAAEPRAWSRPRWLREIHDPLPPPGQDYSGDPYAFGSEGQQYNAPRNAAGKNKAGGRESTKEGRTRQLSWVPGFQIPLQIEYRIAQIPFLPLPGS